MKFSLIVVGAGLSAFFGSCQAEIAPRGLRSGEDSTLRILTGRKPKPKPRPKPKPKPKPTSNKKCFDDYQHKPNDCLICDKCYKDKPESIKFKYNPLNKADSRFQTYDKANCVAKLPFPERKTSVTVQGKSHDIEPGSVFTVKGDFDAYTHFYFDGWDCFIHTSCSQPLVAGDKFGALEVVGGGNCCKKTVVSKNECLICDQCHDNWLKRKPRKLLLQYNPEYAATSKYNTSPRTTCKAGSYPEPTNAIPTTIVVNDIDNDQKTSHDVYRYTSNNSPLVEIPDPGSLLKFTFEDGKKCSIDTSCGYPLVAYDQVGPFIVLDGGECPPRKPPKCIICDKQNKNRPSWLDLRYRSHARNSRFQDYSKASCRRGRPGDYLLSDRIRVEGSGHSVTSGKIFRVNAQGGRFGAETEFSFATSDTSTGSGTCGIHTSCSVPLVTGDQIGPFEVIAGDKCPPPEPPCCEVKAVYNKESSSIDVEWRICSDIKGYNGAILTEDYMRRFVFVGVHACDTKVDPEHNNWYKLDPPLESFVCFQDPCEDGKNIDDCQKRERVPEYPNPGPDLTSGRVTLYGNWKFNHRVDGTRTNGALDDGCHEVNLWDLNAKSAPAFTLLCRGNQFYVDGMDPEFPPGNRKETCV